MRSLVAHLALLAGCAAIPSRYEAVRGELRRDDHAHADTERQLAALSAASPLERAALIAAALSINRDVEAMRQAWRAAAAEVRAETGLDDPMVSYAVAPLSIGAADVRFGEAIELRQKLPFPGKRQLAGEAALDDADALRGELREGQLALAELASQLYDDAYVTARALEVNDHHHALVEQMAKLAAARVASSRGTTQEALQAEVELGQLEHERILLETQRANVAGRLNGILHRAPDAALAPPPRELALPAAPADVASLELAASGDQPQQAAAVARVRAAEARSSLAERAGDPDFEIMASYNSMWDTPEHRWMIGVAVTLPIERGRRAAARDAAGAHVAQARAAAEGAQDQLRVEVARTHRELVAGLHVVELYDQRLLPASRAQVDAAIAGFTAGQNDFAAVIGADRGLRDVELAALRARADAWHRRAALDRAVGRLPGGGAP